MTSRITLSAVMFSGFCLFHTVMGIPSLIPGTFVNISPSSLAFESGPFTQSVAIDPSNADILYLCVCNLNVNDGAGLFKSTDRGSSWRKIGRLVSGPRGTDTMDEPIQIQINPKNPQQIYVADGVRGSSGGIWFSNDGGETFSMPDAFAAHADNSVGGWTIDAYDIKADPTDWNHILVAFHSNFEWTSPGVLESKDGGATWIRHFPIPGLTAAGDGIFFLYNPDLGIGNSNTWLLMAQGGNGSFRTTDGGNTWASVTGNNLEHGGGQIYYTKSGMLYAGGYPHPMRSSDNGATWTTLLPDQTAGYLCMTGDGTTLYTGIHAQVTPPNGRAILISSESDGVNWTNYNSQLFAGGPFHMEYDKVNHILYSASTTDGLWALQVPGATGAKKESLNVAAAKTVFVSAKVFMTSDNRVMVHQANATNARTAAVYDIKGRFFGSMPIGR